MCEIWKPVIGFAGQYEVSTFGRIKSLARKVLAKDGRTFSVEERIVSPALNDKSGHTVINLWNKNKPKHVLVHVVVLEAFVGPCSKNMECRHLDGKGSNNRLDNLTWGTPCENQADRLRHGTSNRGERNGMHKLKVEQVVAIKNAKETHKYLAHKFDVSPATVYAIQSGLRWRWL